MRYGQASHPHHNYHHYFHDHHLEYRLSTLNEQVCGVLALDLWPCGQICADACAFVLLGTKYLAEYFSFILPHGIFLPYIAEYFSFLPRKIFFLTSQNMLVESEIVAAILAVLVIVLRQCSD